MTKKFAIIAIVLGVFATDVRAESRPFGLGIILGQPTGITGKYLMDSNAIDAGIAYSFGSSLLIYGDYHWLFPGFFGNSSEFVGAMTAYVGGGLVLSTSENRTGVAGSTTGFGVGVRVPFGASWRSADHRFEVFLELVPGILIAPRTAALFEGGIGGRFYF